MDVWSMKSRVGPAIFALFIMAVLIPLPITAQQGTGSVTGTIWDNHMVAVPGMDVYILDRPDINTTTDHGGVFILDNVPAGNHTLVFYKDGYDRQTLEITVTAGNITSVGDPMVNKIGLSQEGAVLVILLIVIALVVAILAVRKVVISRRTVIDEIFFMYEDGRLIKHFTRRIKPDMDSDILSSMLVAVQEFVKDSFRGEPGALDQMKFGRYQILIARGNHTIIAAMILGDDLNSMRQRIQNAVTKVDAEFAGPLEHWDGDMDELGDAAALVNNLLIDR